MYLLILIRTCALIGFLNAYAARSCHDALAGGMYMSGCERCRMSSQLRTRGQRPSTLAGFWRCCRRSVNVESTILLFRARTLINKYCLRVGKAFLASAVAVRAWESGGVHIAHRRTLIGYILSRHSGPLDPSAIPRRGRLPVWICGDHYGLLRDSGPCRPRKC